MSQEERQAQGAGTSARIAGIRAKIDKQQRAMEGLHQMRRVLDNRVAIEQTEVTMRETQMNLEYLRQTLEEELRLEASSSQPGSLESGGNGLLESGSGAAAGSRAVSSRTHNSAPHYTRLDLIKLELEPRMLGHRIQYMLEQLEFKQEREKQYREGHEKMARLYERDGDRRNMIELEKHRDISASKIRLLDRLIKNNLQMFVDVDLVMRDNKQMREDEVLRKPVTGRLRITIHQVRDVDHLALPLFRNGPDTYVTLKVDDVDKGRTKGSKISRWLDEFVVDVALATEVELAVYDAKDNQTMPVGINWFLLADLNEELRRKKVVEERERLANWVTPGNFNGGGPQSGPQTGSGGGSQFTGQFSGTDPVPLGPGDGSRAGAPAMGDHNAEDKPVATDFWLSLEPKGRMHVTMSFVKLLTAAQDGRRTRVDGGLGRHGAIRAAKEEVHEQHGHQFVQKLFYNVMRCAYCNEFLRFTGYQCQDCRFLCHPDCYKNVVTKCISKPSVDMDPYEAQLNHRIPHRFQETHNRGTRWCCHCGYILPWGRKKVCKCLECDVYAHLNCTNLIPNLCGMLMVKANQLLRAIQEAKAHVRTPQHLGAPSVLVTPAGHKQPSVPVQSLPGGDGARLPTKVANQVQTQVQAPHQQQPLLQNTGPTQQYAQAQRVPTDPSAAARRRAPPLPLPPLPSAQPDGRPPPVPKHTAAPHQQLSAGALKEQATGKYITGRDDLPPAAPSPNAESSLLLAPPPYGNERPKLGEISGSGREHRRRQERRRKVGIDDFRMIAVLGKGNFGKVMLALLKRTNNLCAIKVLKKDAIIENNEIESLRLEKLVFLVANKERHPFLLNLHCCFQTENRIYFVMEYISGGDLMFHIQRSRFLARQAQFYAAEVLLALKYLHENGIIYRDLKLDNIMLASDGHIKIADYGLCKENMHYQDTTNTFCGTPELMAPELVMEQPYGRAVDWWAFGVLLYQMILNQLPFKGDDQDDMFNAIMHDDVVYNVNMLRELVLLLQALLDKNPETRLGGGTRDALDIMEDQYFRNVDFDDMLHKRVRPPYVPSIGDGADFSNFDLEFTSETPSLTPVNSRLTLEEQEQFRGFSHISDEQI